MTAAVAASLDTYGSLQPTNILSFGRTIAVVFVFGSMMIRCFGIPKHRSQWGWENQLTKYWRFCGVVKGSHHFSFFISPILPSFKLSLSPFFRLASTTDVLEDFVFMYTCFILCLLIVLCILILQGMCKDLIHFDETNGEIVTCTKILVFTDSFNFSLPRQMMRSHDSIVARDLHNFKDVLVLKSVGHHFDCGLAVSKRN